jgi:hypothetical protein
MPVGAIVIVPKAHAQLANLESIRYFERNTWSMASALAWGGRSQGVATSLWELAVDSSTPDLAVGDLLGSSLFNLLILGCIATAFRAKRCRKR